MALVKILASNLFAGANFQKLEVGKAYNVDDAVAEKWIKSGKAESTKEKGEALQFEVSTPSAPVSTDSSALQSKLDDAREQLKAAQDAAEAKDKEHADALAAANKRADDAEAALAAATKKDK